jgi:hypothetical protein
MLLKSFQDPITDLLLKKSNLTKVQFETILIDLLIDIISDEKIHFKEKTLFRSKKISRGSFSRTLSQARANVVSSMFTIILLSYVGVLDANPFQDYENLSIKLREYQNTIEKSELKYSKLILKRIEEELTIGIKALSKPTSIKTM